MFGLSASKLVIVLVVVGPRRMPEYARRLRESVTRLKRWASDVRDGMQDGLSDEFAEVDWQSLDPRQYDPRRIVRGALAEDADAPDGDDSPRDTTSTAGLVADSLWHDIGSRLPSVTRRGRLHLTRKLPEERRTGAGR